VKPHEVARVRIETCPLRPKEHGTKRPLQNPAVLKCFAYARIVGGQSFVSVIHEIKTHLMQWLSLTSAFRGSRIRDKGCLLNLPSRLHSPHLRQLFKKGET